MTWVNESDQSTSWNTQADDSQDWDEILYAGYVILGYVDYVYVEGELISYAVADANNSYSNEADQVTTWL